MTTHEQRMRAEQARQIRKHLEKFEMTMNPDSARRHEQRLAELERDAEKGAA